MTKKKGKANVRNQRQKGGGHKLLLQKVRTWLKWLAGLTAGIGLTLALVFIGVWAVGIETDNWFPLNRLEVKGQRYTEASELYETFRNIEKRGFFSMDMQQTEAVITQLPWVKSVQLRKVWPETLNLQLIEHQPLAFWGDGGVVSKQGQVFYPNELPAKKWVKLNGPENIASELTELLQQYQAQLAQKELFVRSIELTDRGAINLTLDDGVEVKLGNYKVAERLERFISQFDNVRQYKDESLAYVDLRYQNGLVAAWGSNSAGNLNGNSNR